MQDPVTSINDTLRDYHRARSAEMLLRQAREEINATLTESKRQARYSLGRALKAVYEGDNLEHAAPIEFEMSARIAQHLGREPRPGCVFVPVGALSRDLTAAASTGGAELVGTKVAPGQRWVDAFRAASVAMGMGVEVVTAPRQNVAIPRYTTASTAYWLTDEANPTTESTGVLGQVTGTPHTVGAYTEMSRQFFLQAGSLLDVVVEAETAATVAAAVDAAMLAGTGTDGQPPGIVGLSGVGSVSGTSLAWDDVLEFQSDCAPAVKSPSRFGYVSTPTIAKLLATRQRNAGTDAVLWEGSLLNGTMAGHKAMSSTGCPAGDIIAGDWSQVFLLDFGGVEIGVNPYGADISAFKSGTVGLRCFWSVDVVVLRPAAFSVATSVT